AQANANAGADSIVFDPAVFPPAGTTTISMSASLGRYNVTSGPLTITGPGSANCIIDAKGACSVISIESSSAAISGLTVTGGNSGANMPYGGGIFLHASDLTLSDVVVSGNASGLGGGIYAFSYGASTLTMTNCDVSGNTAVVGGGVLIGQNDSLTMTNCVV